MLYGILKFHMCSSLMVSLLSCDIRVGYYLRVLQRGVALIFRETPRNFRNIRCTAVKLTTLGVSTTDVQLDEESEDGAEEN